MDTKDKEPVVHLAGTTRVDEPNEGSGKDRPPAREGHGSAKTKTETAPPSKKIGARGAQEGKRVHR